LAYVASLEERLRSYEQNGVQANVQLQKLAKKLDSENRKLKRVIFELAGIGESEVERTDLDTLVEEIRVKLGGNGASSLQSPRSIIETNGHVSRSCSFSGGTVETICAYSPSAPFICYPVAPISDVRSQKPPTPPPSKDELNPAQGLLLALAPKSAPDCADGFGPGGKRFCGLLQLLAGESEKSIDSTPSVPCRVSYELLKSLIDEKDALAIENAAFELKDGIQIMENGICNVDAKVLAKVLSRLTSTTTEKDNRIGMMVNA
jgi:hypothetical protein